MTVIAKEVAETSFNDPPKSPMGVLVALTITTSLIVFSFHLSSSILSKIQTPDFRLRTPDFLKSEIDPLQGC